MEGPVFDIYEWEAALPDVHKSTASKLSSMKPSISFHLVFFFLYWLSYSRIYQKDNPILQGAGIQQLRRLFHLWLHLILKLLCNKVLETSSCRWTYHHIWPMYNPVSAQNSDLTWRKSAQVPNQVSTTFFLSFSCYPEWENWKDWTSPTLRLLSICSCISSLSRLQAGDTSAPQAPYKEQRHSVSGSSSRDLAPKCQALQHITSRLLNFFSNLTLSNSEI